jgi:large subunit ribosomal protein L29
MSVAELEQKLNGSRQKLFQLKFKNSSGQLKNPLEIRVLRRDIARIKTILAATGLSKEKED